MATIASKKPSFEEKPIRVNPDVPFNPKALFFQDKKDRAEETLTQSILVDPAFAKRVEKEQGR